MRSYLAKQYAHLDPEGMEEDGNAGEFFSYVSNTFTPLNAT